MAIVYRCEHCRREYTPEEANQANYVCHGSPLKRVTVPDPSSEKPLAWLGEPSETEWAVRRIIPPPENITDAAAVEQLLGSLHGTTGPLAMEIAGNARRREMLIRGRPHVVDHVAHQLQAAYGQVSWEDPGDDDPGLCLLNSDDPSIVYRRMKLRRDFYFPLRTWREFDEADPLPVLLGAFRGLDEGESLFSQLVLLRPAPNDWADAYQGMASYTDFRVKAASPAGQVRSGLFALGIIVGTLDLVALCLAVGVFLRPAVGFFDVLKTISGIGFLTALNAGIAVSFSRAWRRLNSHLNANPEVVQRKVSLPAFECQLRLWAVAPKRAKANRLMDRLVSAYALFGLAEGNALTATETQEIAAPHVLPSSSPLPAGTRRLKALGLGKMNGRNDLVLNLAELAGLWHLPVGNTLELVEREGYERYVPLPKDVSDPNGVPIGISTKDDQTHIPVSLSRDAIRRNVLLMGKTQMGKSNIMEILARLAMYQEGSAVVVLDPQGDMVRRLCGLVPPNCVHETYYVDFADRQRCVGLNLLDMTLGTDVDKVVSDLIGLGESLWAKYWGPRMEAVWRYATKTLALINAQRVAMGKPETQYTVLDIPPLLLAPREQRRDFLMTNLPPDTPEGRDAHWWWSRWYETMRTSMQQDVISPVLTKIFRLAGHGASRNVVGQPVSTLNLREVLRQGGILLVHTATGELGEEIGGFMGAVILNLLNVVIRERSAAVRSGRMPCMVIVDEFQSIPAVDYGALLSELQKFEVAFVLGTQSLARLRIIERELPGIVFAGVTTLMSFQINYEDAEYVSGELDGVPPASLVNLEPFHAYVKTTDQQGRRVPVYSVKSSPPPASDPGVAARVLEQVAGYSVLAGQVQERAGLELELRDNVEARQQEENLTAWLQSRQDKDFVDEQQLTNLAHMTATASSQSYDPTAGSIGRGLSVGRRKKKRGRKRGYSVASG